MRYFLSVLALAALTASPALAQEGMDGAAERPMFSVALLGGGFSPTGELNDGSRFDAGASFGGALTVWPEPDIGLRASALWTRTPIDAPADTDLAGQEPDVWFFGADLLYHLPLDAVQEWGWYPYLLGGLGIKHYDFDFADPYEKDHSDWGGSVGGGLEYRFGRWGFHAEARGLFSKFDRAGYRDNQRDVIYTAGFNLHF